MKNGPENGLSALGRNLRGDTPRGDEGNARADGAGGGDGASAPDVLGSAEVTTLGVGLLGVRTPGMGEEGVSADELALRRLLHTAVEDLEPSEGALDHLRRAVPHRRARKRQALVGAAAAVLLCGTAIPAFVHVASSNSTSESDALNVGHGAHTRGGTGHERGPGGIEKDTQHAPGTRSDDDPSRTDATATPKDTASNSVGGGAGGTPKPGDTLSASSPVCDPSQLKLTTSVAQTPDANGNVYGTFRVANVSGSNCSVAGKGSITIAAAGAADEAKIAVVNHTSGDQATGLPDPSQEATALVLAPDNAYEVQFAWVPDDTCPTTGASPDPSPTDNASADGGSAGVDPTPGTESGTDTSDTASQLVDDGGGTADGSVTVSHTAEPGAPSASTTIPNACSGTIYRTGVLPPSS